MESLLQSIAARKARLDQLRPVSREALKALQKSWDVDLTYTSNAIEGNTLTLRETAELIEHGITVAESPSAIIWKLSIITMPSSGCGNWRAGPVDRRKHHARDA